MSDLAGTCCLVTGGAGFIGSTIVDQLLTAGVSEVRMEKKATAIPLVTASETG